MEENAIVTNLKLADALKLVARQFDIDALATQQIGRRNVGSYYRWNYLAYRYYHSRAGAIHMAINPDGVFDDDGYLAQARLVQPYVETLPRPRVLELASGNGFNSAHLARRNPGVAFRGIDLSHHHVLMSKFSTRSTANVSFGRQDFEDIKEPAGKYGLVFTIESICHAQSMAKVLDESYRVLAPGGVMVVFDAFRSPVPGGSADLSIATRLVEHAMAVDSFMAQDEWLDIAREVGFEPVKSVDLSSQVMPNMMKLQDMSVRFFTGRLSKTYGKNLIPAAIKQNAVAGLLLPFTMSAKAHVYSMHVLRRAGS